MRLARFTAQGLERFSGVLDAIRASGSGAIPADLLEDSPWVEPVGESSLVVPAPFSSRMEAASYFYGLLAQAGLQDPERDGGLWAWFTAAYFDAVCRKDRDGRLKPGERARWIPELDNFQRYYRHLLLGPYLIYRAHSDQPGRVAALLCGQVSSPGDIAEQLASRQELVSNRALMQVATDLYVNPATGKAKSGAGGKGGGSARRLADVVNQFDLTWDLYDMVPGGLLMLLPKEFSKFRTAA